MGPFTSQCFLSCPPSAAVLDAAFLAREKAKADAEYYAAQKLADSNKVSTGKLSLTLPPHRRSAPGGQHWRNT